MPSIRYPESIEKLYGNAAAVSVAADTDILFQLESLEGKQSLWNAVTNQFYLESGKLFYFSFIFNVISSRLNTNYKMKSTSLGQDVIPYTEKFSVVDSAGYPEEIVFNIWFLGTDHVEDYGMQFWFRSSSPCTFSGIKLILLQF